MLNSNSKFNISASTGSLATLSDFSPSVSILSNSIQSQELQSDFSFKGTSSCTFGNFIYHLPFVLAKF